MGQGRKPSLIASFQQHYGDLVRFLTWRTGDADHAADVAQETYLRLSAVQQSGLQVDNPRSFMLRVARNLSIDHLRKESHQIPSEIREEELAAITDPEVAPDDAVLSRERLRLLDLALQELPAKPRQALLLHRVSGLSQAEIAARLGVSESMVVKYVAQAMAHCRRWRDRLEGEQ